MVAVRSANGEDKCVPVAIAQLFLGCHTSLMAAEEETQLFAQFGRQDGKVTAGDQES